MEGKKFFGGSKNLEGMSVKILCIDCCMMVGEFRNIVFEDVWVLYCMGGFVDDVVVFMLELFLYSYGGVWCKWFFILFIL